MVDVVSMLLGAAALYVVEHVLNLDITKLTANIPGLSNAGSKYAESYYGYDY
jgi:hypothetical protein